MSETTYVITAVDVILQVIGWLALAVLLIWRFFIPPSVNHLGTGVNIYNINCKEKQERGLIALLAAITLVITIEKPELFGGGMIKSSLVFHLYLAAFLLTIFGIYSFLAAHREEPFIQLSERNRGIPARIWGTVQSVGYFVFGIAICFLWLTLEGASFDMGKPSLTEDTSIPNAEVISLALYSKPDNSSQAIQVVIPKANISTASGTCYFYQVTVIDTSGVTHEGFIHKGGTELKQAGIDILQEAGYSNKCKSNPVRRDTRTNENEPLDFG
ncbi:MAG: hypothetical protein AAFN81_25395 [Bacteroidota bacterium]